MGQEPSDAIPISALLYTVFESIAEVFLLCLAGYILASTGVTDKATQRKLNVINVSLFTPALLFSKVAFSLTPSKLREMWIIPIGFIMITSVSAGVAWTMSKIFRLRKSQTAFAICAAMFQNSNSLPIALVQSLVSVVPGLKWGSHDSKDQMLGRALTYLVLYSTLGMVLRWSWGVKLLAGADDDEDAAGSVPAPAPVETPAPGHISILPANLQAHNVDIMSPASMQQDDPFASPERMQSFAAENRLEANGARSSAFIASSLPLNSAMRSPRGASRDASPASRHRGRRESTGMSRSSSQTRRPRAPSRAESGRELLGLPEQPRQSHLVDLAEDSSESEAEDADEWQNGLPSTLRRRITPPMSPRARAWRTAKRRVGEAWVKFYSFMTVPTWAALISIFIALIPPLQAEVSSVRPFVAAVKSAGQCSIPVTLVVLGAFFYVPAQTSVALPDEHQDNSIKGWIERKIRGLKGYVSISQDKDKPKAYQGENRAVFVAVVSRMIVTPLLFLPLIALLARYDWFPAAEDPVFILCAVLLVSSPPALTLAQLTQAASGDAFERLISKTISWSYAVLTPPLTLVYVVIGLVFGKL